MPAADTNRASLLYVAESTFGTTPATPTMKYLRFTGEGLKADTATVKSQEIRSDRQVPDVIRTSLSASGDINGEFSYGMWDDWLEAVLLSAAWSSPVNVAGLTLTVAASAGTITRSAGDFVSAGFVANMYVLLSGFTNAVNNSYFKVTNVTTTVLTVQQVSASTRLVNEVSGAAACTANQGAQIVNGIAFKSYTIERQYTDISTEFAGFVGMSPDAFNMNVTKDGIITNSFGFMGKKELPSYSATLATTTNAAPTNDVMNAVDDVKCVLEGGGVQYDITDMTFSLKNNLRTRLQVGTLGAISIGTGTFDCSGTHRAYFQSKTIMDKYLSFTATNMAIAMLKSGKGYVFDFPRIKYTSGQRVAGGINQDVIADMAWMAMRDPTEGITMRIQRFT